MDQHAHPASPTAAPRGTSTSSSAALSQARCLRPSTRGRPAALLFRRSANTTAVGKRSIHAWFRASAPLVPAPRRSARPAALVPVGQSMATAPALSMARTARHRVCCRRSSCCVLPLQPAPCRQPCRLSTLKHVLGETSRLLHLATNQDVEAGQLALKPEGCWVAS